MGFLRKRNLALVFGGVGLGFAGFKTNEYLNREEISAEEFHNRQLLALKQSGLAKEDFLSEKILTSKEALPKTEAVLYKLRSCPYCAIVQSLLDYGQVPYTEALPDTLTGSGMPAVPYAYVPQVKFVFSDEVKAKRADAVDRGDVEFGKPGSSSAGAAEGFHLVDSDVIARKFGPLLGLATPQTFEDPHVIATRAWIKDIFVRASFVAMCGTYDNAWIAYPHLVSPNYNFLPCKIVGAGVLSLMASKMTLPKFAKPDIQPRLPNQGRSVVQLAPKKEEGENQERPDQKERGGDDKVEEKKYIVTEFWDAEKLLGECADQFVQEFIPKGQHFFGGSKPNLVDVEMYGVVRNCCMQSPPVKQIIAESNLGPWVTRMKDVVPSKATTH